MKRIEIIAIMWFVPLAAICCTESKAQLAAPRTEVQYGPTFKNLTRNLSKEELALIEEYRVNFARLRYAYGHAQIDATFRKKLDRPLAKPENPDGKAAVRLSYRANEAKLFRIDIEPLEWKTEEPIGRKTVHVVGPEFSFTAYKSGPEKSLAITNVYQQPQELLDLKFLIYDFHNAPYEIRAERLIFGYYEDWWQMDRVEAYDEAGVRMVAVICGSDIEGQKGIARYEFLRDGAWAQKFHKVGVAQPTKPFDGVHTRVFEYEGDMDGVPMLKRATYQNHVGPEQELVQEEVYEITRFVPGPVDEAEFLPEALGLAMAESKVNWWPRILVLVVGIILVALYVRLKRRATA